MMRHNAPRGQMMPPEIHELELELQLLKRKRQLLQQQQDLLIGGHQNNRERQRDYNYDQSSQMYNQQHTQDFDFSHLYDDRVTGSGNRGRQFGQKRHAVDPWESNAPPKRFHGSRGKPKNVAGSRSNQGFVSRRGGGNFRQRSDRPQPLRNVDTRPNTGNRNASKQNSSLKGVRKDFQPSRVTKPKAVSPPNKLESYSRSDRKKLIGKALTTVDDESFVLSADKPATPTQSGRMELALGNILKDLRQDFSTKEKYKEIFQSERLLKVVKQTLRDRIRSVMIGQPIIGMKTIIDTYREKYPRESDQEIVDTALEVAFMTRHENKLAIRLVESEIPETYFKINMGKLLDVKLGEMFKKLEKVYADENDEEDIQAIIDGQLPADPNTEHHGEDKDKYDPVDAFKNTDGTNESANDSANNIDTSIKDNVTNEDNNSSTIVDADPTVGDAVPSNENAELSTENDVPSMAETAPSADDVMADDNKDKSMDKNDENTSKSEDKIEKEETSDSDAKFLKAWKSYNSKYFTSDFYDRLINRSLSYKLPRLLPKYKDTILKILDMDKQYKSTKTAILGKVNKKTDEGHLAINYYVKIFGRPGLPRRKLMGKFLDDYNPLTIKKHKTVHNLLFVGFHHKEDFEKILAATGTRIGNVTLTIAVSEWKNISKTGDKDDSTEVEAQSADDQGDKEEKSLINEDLDTQISDLLTSIRKEDSPVKNDNQTDLECTEETTDKNMEDVKVEENKDAESEQAANGVKVEVEKSDENKTFENQNKTVPEQVEGIKTEVKKVAVATPTRSSTRLATSTPSSITTRRTSKLS